ncbi:hypothetical protein L1049_001840 [Liquidambar formosana]|uniref:Protein kinase domain-containing protein n=1 Tax=Liquidambar formosana TaxID=63359 RepID=A0AAP0NFY4_LIQFO
MYLGYIVLGLALVFFIIVCKVFKRTKTKEEKIEAPNKVVAVDESSNKPSAVTSEYKTGMSRSDISITSTDSVLVSSSLVVLTSPVANGLKFEDLLKAPAELLGRGKHSSIYKVVINDGMTLAVKRIKDWAISKDDFKWRMQKIDQVKHPNVLPPLAFYCSKQEKLLVYEYQKNGSLFKLLHGTQMGRQFDWASRLNVASRIAEALAFMHHELRDEGIGHGNLKSNNILFNEEHGAMHQ